MMRYAVMAACLLAAYLTLLGPFTQAMAQKTYAVKLGMRPPPQVLQILFHDYQEFLAAFSLGQVIQYYGTLTESRENIRKASLAIDYPAMSRAVHDALRLDPYNMDGYYFGQSILVWDVGQYQLATELLEYGMQYRTWDWQLPFFAGFNKAYFLKDRAAAAPFYKLAGELSGSILFKKLAGRYLQEAGETQMAIDYLQTLEQSAKTPAVKKSLQLRITAFKAVLVVEQARDLYSEKLGRPPLSIDSLVAEGYLEGLPVDPYGGEFSLNKTGQVVTTSKFAFAGSRNSAANAPVKLPSEK